MLLLTGCRLAQEYGLHLLYKAEFHDIFEAEREHREYKPLLQRMNVVSASGESQMDEDQWDAASASCLSHPLSILTYSLSIFPKTLDIYLGFAFEKR